MNYNHTFDRGDDMERTDGMTPHEKKYDDLAEWLSIKALQSLVPFSQAKIDYALTNRDDVLNTLPLSVWDRQHLAVWRLQRMALCQDQAMGKEIKKIAWSISHSVCVLKHVARFYPREES